MTTYNYFQVSFYYEGPKGDETDPKCNTALIKADDEVEALGKNWLAGKGVHHKLAYRWPDGSLYEYMRTEHSKEQLSKIIQEGLEHLKLSITVEHIHEAEADEDPYKYNAKTLQEYFEKKK